MAISVCAWVSEQLLAETRRFFRAQMRSRTNGIRGGPDSLTATLTDSGIRRILWSRVSSLEELQRARVRGIRRLVIDPAEVEVDRCVAVVNDPALAKCLSSWRQARVVVVCRPTPPMLHAVHVISKVVPTSLMVIGIDGFDVLDRALGLDVDLQDLGCISEVLGATASWPPLLRRSLESAIAAPQEWSVKKMAAAACVSRRTLERYFATAGLSGPGTVLRRVRLVPESAKDPRIEG